MMCICYCFPIQNKLVMRSNANGNPQGGFSGFGKSWVFTLLLVSGFLQHPQWIILQERLPRWFPAPFWQEGMCPFSCENNLGKLTKNKLWRPLTCKELWLESNFFRCGPGPSPTDSSEFIVKYIMGKTCSLNNEVIHYQKQTKHLEKEISTLSHTTVKCYQVR